MFVGGRIVEKWNIGGCWSLAFSRKAPNPSESGACYITLVSPQLSSSCECVDRKDKNSTGIISSYLQFQNLLIVVIVMEGVW
jgi:hypothetical protein